MQTKQLNPQARKMQPTGVFIIFVCFAWLATGCAVGPHYKRPGVDSPARFRSGPSEAPTNTLADLQWWEIYRDPVLSSLIRTALTNNYDARIAVTRVEQPRAI